jgi:hypothetical protein
MSSQHKNPETESDLGQARMRAFHMLPQNAKYATFVSWPDSP